MSTGYDPLEGLRSVCPSTRYPKGEKYKGCHLSEDVQRVRSKEGTQRVEPVEGVALQRVSGGLTLGRVSTGLTL